MALRKIVDVEGKVSIHTPMGVVNNGVQRISFSAYIKVINFTGNKENLTANVSFKGETQEFVKQYQIPLSVDAGSTNFIAQTYEHLKTLSEFAGAENC
jgi:hypothetical protein